MDFSRFGADVQLTIKINPISAAFTLFCEKGNAEVACAILDCPPTR